VEEDTPPMASTAAQSSQTLNTVLGREGNIGMGNIGIELKKWDGYCYLVERLNSSLICLDSFLFFVWI
jgi:hypothetical protein